MNNLFKLLTPYPNKSSVSIGPVPYQLMQGCSIFITTQKFHNGKIQDHTELLALGMINEVEHRIYPPMSNLAEEYIIKLIPANSNEEKTVIIPQKLYGKPGMVTSLTQAGMLFPNRLSDGKCASLLLNHISSNVQKKETHVNYHNGVNNDQYLFLTDKDNKSDISTPYYENRLEISHEDTEPSVAVQHVFDCSRLFGEKVWLQLITFLTYSLFHTLFSKKGYRIQRILLLGGKGAFAASKFLQVYNKSVPSNISLSNNITYIHKKIFDTKDAPIIFSGDDNKIQNLVNIFCEDNHYEIVINKKRQPLLCQSLCVVCSNTADKILENSNYFRIMIHDDVDGDKINSQLFGDFLCLSITLFADLVNAIPLDDILNEKKIIASKEFESPNEINELTIFLSIYKFITLFFAKFNINISDILCDCTAVDFFSDLICGEQSDNMPILLNKTRDVLLNTVLNCNKILRYNKNLKNVPLSTDEPTIMYDTQHIYFYGEQFAEFIVKHISKDISKLSLLELLKENELLHTNNSSNTVKLTVQIEDNTSNRSSWIAIKRSFLESPLCLPIIEEGPAYSNGCVLLGRDCNSKNVYLPLREPKVCNYHIGITGDSGTGKSYATLSIIDKLSKEGISTVIIDSENSFSDNTIEKSFVDSMGKRLEILDVYSNKIPINIFERQTISDNGTELSETNTDIASRTSQLLARVCNLSEKQINVVFDVILKLLNKANENRITLSDLCTALDKDERPEAGVARGRLIQITAANVFQENGISFSWEKQLQNGRCLIFSLAKFENEQLKRMIYEAILQDLWMYAKRMGTKEQPFAVAIDEIELIPPVHNSTFAKFLNLGRKFGAMCIWNTTLIAGKFSQSALTALNQSGTRLYFKTSDPDEQHYIKKCLSKHSDTSTDIKQLKKGRCIASGTFSSDAGNIYENKLLLLDIPEIS